MQAYCVFQSWTVDTKFNWAGTMGRGKRRSEAFFRLFPLPIVPRARGYISIIAIFFGIPSGSTSAKERGSFLKHLSGYLVWYHVLQVTNLFSVMTPFLRLLFWLIQIVVLHYFNIFKGESLIRFIYYIDTSVLLENIPLEKFTKTTSGTRVVYFPLSHTWVYRWRNFRNFHPKFVGVLHLLNFTYTFSKALLIFCHSAQCYFWRLL